METYTIPKTPRVDQAIAGGAQAVHDLVNAAQTAGNDLTPKDYLALGYLLTSDQEFVESALLWGFNNRAERPKSLAYQIGAYVARMGQDRFDGESADRIAAFLGMAFIAATSFPDEDVRAAAASVQKALEQRVAKGFGLSAAP